MFRRLKASSAAHVCIILNVALSRAVELRLLATHPGEPVKKRKPRPAPRRDFEVLDRAQCSRLLAAARDTDLFPIVLIALATGMRRNEILALTWDRVDLENAEIAVEETIVYMAGVTTRKLPKNGKPRVVPIPQNVVTELRQHRLQQAEALLHLGVRQTGSTEVCRRGVDGAMRTPLSVTNAFGRLAKRIGLSATFHGLRHAHASELLRAGVPVNVAADRLGHSDGGMLLLRTYAHTTSDAARDAAERISALFEN
jgi:integrase